MATPKVYVICDQNCKFEAMTKEQIYTAIVQAVNEGTIGDIDTGFVQTIKTINGTPLKFFVGTQYEYNALSSTDKENLFAIISDDTTKEGMLAAIEALRLDVDGLLATLADVENLKSDIEELDDFWSAAPSYVGTTPSVYLDRKGYYLIQASIEGATSNFGLIYWDGLVWTSATHGNMILRISPDGQMTLTTTTDSSVDLYGKIYIRKLESLLG